MECQCVRHTDLPHTTRLFADSVYDFPRVAAFYRHRPDDPDSFAAAARELSFAPEQRYRLASALEALNGPSQTLDRLREPGTVAVVTGQQVGLYSGPVYTIYKALTAVRLARKLSAEGIPAVPVFWLATEDHDFAEVSRSWVFNSSYDLVGFHVESPAGDRAPVGPLPLTGPPNASLRNVLAGLPYGDDVAAMVERSYRPGESLGGAFRRLLREVLSGFDLLFVDPMHPEMRRLAAPVLAEAMRQAEDLSAAVEARNQALDAAGYHAQVHWDRQTSFVFLLEDGRRLALKRNGTSYQLGARRFAAGELIDRAVDLSPNALLRPVIQDAMLPTVAYVGGPAELAYLAQSEVLYDRLLGRMPVAIPRAGFTLFDARAAKLVKRYGLGSCPNPLADLLAGEEHLRARIAARLAPPELAGSMAAARESTARALDRLAADLVAYDPTLAAALAKSRRKIDHQLLRVEGRIGRETLRRDTRAASDAHFLANLVYPGKHLQERVYSVLPFLARFGLDLPARIYDHIQPGCADHQIAIL